MRWHLLVQSQIKKTSSSWCSRRVKRNLTFLRKEKGGKILRMCDISRRPREIGPNFGNSQGAQKGKRMAYGSCLKTKPVCWKCEGPWDMAHILARHLAYNVPTTVSPKHTCTSSRVPFSVFFFFPSDVSELRRDSGFDSKYDTRACGFCLDFLRMSFVWDTTSFVLFGLWTEKVIPHLF